MEAEDAEHREYTRAAEREIKPPPSLSEAQLRAGREAGAIKTNTLYNHHYTTTTIIYYIDYSYYNNKTS